MKKLILLLVLLNLLACTGDSFIPQGLYDNQVERLLTGGGEQGSWLISSMSIDGERQEIVNCSDTVIWVFDQVSSDSISTYSLMFDAACVFYDTLFFGEASASGRNALFSDSIKFDAVGTVNDRFMGVTLINPSLLEVFYELSDINYVVSLRPVPSLLLPRQASSMLTNGLSIGDNALWRATSETIGVRASTLLDSCVNAKFLFFERKSTNTISLVQRTSDTTCVLTEQFLGNVLINENEGYFSNRISLSGGILSEIDLTSLDQDEMSISYVNQDSVSVQAVYSKN